MEYFCMLEQWEEYQSKKIELRKFRSQTVMFVIRSLQRGETFYGYPNLQNNPGTLQYLKLYDDVWEIILQVEQKAIKAYWIYRDFTERLESLMEKYYSELISVERLCVEYLDLTSEMIEDTITFFNVGNPKELYDILCFTNPWTLVRDKVDCQKDGNLYLEYRVFVQQSPNSIVSDSEDEREAVVPYQTVSHSDESDREESEREESRGGEAQTQTQLIDREEALGQSASEAEGNSYVGKVMLEEQGDEIISPKLRAWGESIFSCAVVINDKLNLALFDSGAELSSVPLNLIKKSQILPRTVNVHSYLNKRTEMTLANVTINYKGLAVNVTALVSPVHKDRILLGRDFMFALQNKMEEKGFRQPLFFLTGMGTLEEHGAGHPHSSEVGMHPVRTRLQSRKLAETRDKAHTLEATHESNQSSDQAQPEGVVSQEMESNSREKVIWRANGKVERQRPVTQIYFPSAAPGQRALQPQDGATTSPIEMQPSVPVDSEILSSSRQKFKNELQNDLTLEKCREQAVFQPAEPTQKGGVCEDPPDVDVKSKPADEVALLKLKRLDRDFEDAEMVKKEPAKQKQFLSFPPPSFVSIQVQEEEVRAKLKVLMVVCKTILIDDVNLKQVIHDSDGWKHHPPDLLTLFVVVVLSHCILQVFRSLIILIDDHDDSYDPVWKLNDRDLCDLSLSDMDTWKWIIEPFGEDPEICADDRDDIDWDPDG